MSKRREIALKLTAAVTGVAMGLAGVAFAAGILVAPAKLFVFGDVVTPPADTTAPTVISIVRSGTSPTNAPSVQFTVSFSEDVTGVDETDFALTTTGTISGTSVSGVSSDSGSTRTITVATGTGDGTVRLDVTDDDSILDTASNPLGGAGVGNGNFTTGESYTIDRTGPTVSAIVRASSNPTNASSVQFTVTFSEAVTGVDTADFTVTQSGVSGAVVTDTSTDSGSTRTITVSTGTGEGTIRLDVTDDDSIVDTATNPLGGPVAGNGNFTTGEAFTIDRTGPTVSSITRVGTTPTNATSVQFTVTFSEGVTGVGAADFALATTGAISGAGISTVSADSGTTRTVTVATGNGSGTIGLNLTDDDSIVDAATNPLGGAGAGNGNFTGQTYTIDKTAPTASITFPASGGLYRTATFDSGCSTGGGDFCGSAADETSLASVQVSLRQGSGNYWSAATSSFSSSTEILLATIGLPGWTFNYAGTNFPADGPYTLRAEPRDTAGNVGTASVTFTIDNTAPTGTDVQTANKTAGTAGRAEIGDTVTLTFSEQMSSSSMVSGWDGSALNVVVRLQNGTGQGNDSLAFYDATNTTLLPLGTVDLANGGYNTANGNTIVTFGASGTASTMVMSGSQIVFTLGTASSTTVGTVTTNGTMVWTTVTGPTDRAGNPLSTGSVNETGTADREF